VLFHETLYLLGYFTPELNRLCLRAKPDYTGLRQFVLIGSPAIEPRSIGTDYEFVGGPDRHIRKTCVSDE
jgi:hypothetical protein